MQKSVLLMRGRPVFRLDILHQIEGRLSSPHYFFVGYPISAHSSDVELKDFDAIIHPMLSVLSDCLCRQITFDEDLEDVPAILLLEDVVHTGFKFRERGEAIEGLLSNPVSGFVMMCIHERRELRL